MTLQSSRLQALSADTSLGSDAKSFHVNDEGVCMPAMSFNWPKDITKDFSQNVNNSVASINENLDCLHQNVNQEEIENFYSQVCKVFTDAAQDVGACKWQRPRNINRSKRCVENKPWFNAE